MIRTYNWFFALIVGIALVMIAYYVVPQPLPLPTIETIIGWILIVVGILGFLLGFLPPRSRRL